MNLPPELLQFLGSLFAILALAAIARALRLGKEPKLMSDDDAHRAAGEAVDGFKATGLARDHEGRGAILRDAAGRLLVLKPHGNHFASRILTSRARARLWQDKGKNTLEIDCGERRFGSVILEIENPQAWAEAINGLEANCNA